jgi:hypothetical protein
MLLNRENRLSKCLIASGAAKERFVWKKLSVVIASFNDFAYRFVSLFIRRVSRRFGTSRFGIRFNRGVKG